MAFYDDAVSVIYDRDTQFFQRLAHQGNILPIGEVLQSGGSLGHGCQWQCAIGDTLEPGGRTVPVKRLTGGKMREFMNVKLTKRGI